MCYEIFYLFVKVLKFLQDNSDFTGPRKSLVSKPIFEITCKYLNDFLILSRSALCALSGSVELSTTSLDEVTASNSTIQHKLTEKFSSFLLANSADIYDTIINLSETFYACPTTFAISVGSQLVIMKQTGQQSIELHLAKSLVQIFEENPSSKRSDDDFLILDLLLELYIKSISFRHCLNECCATFHLNLLACLSDYFKQDQQDPKYLELLLELIFVYFYFNRKKDLKEVYEMLRKELANTPSLLLVYFNVIILAKAFKLNRILLEPSQVADTKLGPALNTDYDADIETEGQQRRFELNGYTGGSQFRYDLILLPRLLDICLGFIAETRSTHQYSAVFLKRLVHLLETCSFNIHIFLGNNVRGHLMSLLTGGVNDEELTRHCLQSLYYSSLYDMNEAFLLRMFELFKANQSTNVSRMCSDVILKLCEHLQPLQATQFMRMPRQSSQEPIDYLLSTQQTAGKKWRLTDTSDESNESAEQVACIRIPLNVQSATAASPTANGKGHRIHSYSLGFMIRFNNNLAEFFNSYGLANSENKCMNAHLVSVSLGPGRSSFEMWLSSSGDIVFRRRVDNVIVFTMNLMSITCNSWHFIHVDYEEKESISSNTTNCRIEFSVDAAELTCREFELQQLAHQPASGQPSSCLLIGHEKKTKELACLFHYDLGQVVLSKGNLAIFYSIFFS